MKTHSIGVINITCHESTGVLQQQRYAEQDALGFQGAVPALDLAVALGIIW
jgi:hypothetical protein